MTRQYQLVLLGASGYTGKLTAQYIAANVPTDIKWAIAGRSQAKLEELAEVCKALSPDRIQPAIEICNLNDLEVSELAQKTTLLISTVGPYSKYGEHAFKACAENGTNYLDCTGESVWVLKMINKYEKIAKTTGAIMIPQIGIESMPSDLITWSLISEIRNKLSAPTSQVILSVEIKAHVSGGTLATILSILDHFSIRELAAASLPYALSPIPGPTVTAPTPITSRLFGVRTIPGLGLLTPSPQADADRPIVQRSWGLLGGAELYGPNFTFEQYMPTSSYFAGFFTHITVAAATALALLPPVRWLAKRLVIQPGGGASMEECLNDHAYYKAIAYPDTEGAGKGKKAFCEARWNGGMYELTGLIMTQAAMSIMKDDVVAKKLGGGVLTPATLGQPFLDRIHASGFTFNTRIVDE